MSNFITVYLDTNLSINRNQSNISLWQMADNLSLTAFGSGI